MPYIMTSVASSYRPSFSTFPSVSYFPHHATGIPRRGEPSLIAIRLRSSFHHFQLRRGVLILLGFRDGFLCCERVLSISTCTGATPLFLL